MWIELNSTQLNYWMCHLYVILHFIDIFCSKRKTNLLLFRFLWRSVHYVEAFPFLLYDWTSWFRHNRNEVCNVTNDYLRNIEFSLFLFNKYEYNFLCFFFRNFTFVSVKLFERKANWIIVFYSIHSVAGIHIQSIFKKNSCLKRSFILNVT